MPRARKGRPDRDVPIPSLDDLATVGDNTQIAWERVREAYVQGLDVNGQREFLSIEAIGNHFGLSSSSMKRRASKERWVEQRSAYLTSQAARIKRERQSRLAKTIVDFDDRALATAQLGMTMVTARLGEIAQDHRERARMREANERALVENIPIKPVDKNAVSSIDARELESLSRAAQVFHDLGRNAAGEEARTYLEQTELAQEETQSVTRTLTDDTSRVNKIVEIMKRAGLLPTDVVEQTAIGPSTNGTNGHGPSTNGAAH